MFRQRSRFSRRQVQVGGCILLLLFLWLVTRGEERISRHKSPYAQGSHYIGNNDVLPIVDITVQECTRWQWFQKRSICAAMIQDGWQVSGGDLLLDTGKHRAHLFIKRQPLSEYTLAITDIRISPSSPSEDVNWEERWGGIWINRRVVDNIQDAVTAVDFIHGRNIRELRRGRQFASGGRLLLGPDINLSFRKGIPPPRQIPTLKVAAAKPYKVLQAAGISVAKMC
jgi:hypothetical protein